MTSRTLKNNLLHPMQLHEKISSSLLLLAGCLSLFVIPALFPGDFQRPLYSLTYIFIFLAALKKIGTSRWATLVVIILILLQMTGQIFQWKLLELFSSISNVFFFTFIVIKLILIISRKKEVSTLIILDAVSAYLLIGITFFLFNLILTVIHPEALQQAGSAVVQIEQVLYYTMVTFTTLGYGDIIPANSIARGITTLNALSGQVYLTIVIALIVGKYLSQEKITPE
jgi:voltage-gated potassium channel